MEVKELVDQLKSAFEQFKAANEERLKQIEAKGSADPLLEGKVNTANADLTRLQNEIASLKRMPMPGAGGEKQLSEDQVAHRKGFMGFLRKGREDNLRDLEQKAMSVGSDPDGGYFVPVDMSGRLVQRIYETSPIRQYAAVDTISTDSLKGSNDLDEAGAGWVGETETRTETDTPTTGEWEIFAKEQYAEPKITQKLLDDSAYDVEAWLGRKVGDKFARQENYAFILGDGIKRPRGLFTYPTVVTADATRAWGQLQHVVTGAAGDWAASNPADKLIELVYSLKAGYRQAAAWAMARALVADIRKFKDGNGQYIWAPGLTPGQPQTILSYPVAEMEDVPAKAANSLSVGFGNIREAYQIVDRLGIRVLRDPYTAKGWIKFYTTKRVGGDVVNFEAFKFLKFSA